MTIANIPSLWSRSLCPFSLASVGSLDKLKVSVEDSGEVNSKAGWSLGVWKRETTEETEIIQEQQAGIQKKKQEHGLTNYSE
jgi:hypothetical protein